MRWKAANDAVQVNFGIRGDNTAPDSGIVRLRLVSDGAAEPLAIVAVNFTLQEATPSLVNEPPYLEMGTARDDSVLGTLTLGNQGLAALQNLAISLTMPDAQTPAPDWLSLATPATVAALDVGESTRAEISAQPSSAIPEADYEFRLKVTAHNAPDRLIPVYVAVTQSGVGNVLFHASDIYTATLDENNNVIPGLQGAQITLQNEQVLSNTYALTTDEFGNALFEDVPAGRYIYRASASDHQDESGRLTVQPGVTEAEEVFLSSNLVTVEWSVDEIALQDRYQITLEATFKTSVPAAVIVASPMSVNLPVLREGETFYGEFTVTNHGFIKAQRLNHTLPRSDDYLQFEFLTELPDQLLAGDVLTVPYRVTALRDIDEVAGDASGGATCISKQYHYAAAGEYVCAVGQTEPCGTRVVWYFSLAEGSCGSGGTGGAGGGAFGGWLNPGDGTTYRQSPAPLSEQVITICKPNPYNRQCGQEANGRGN